MSVQKKRVQSHHWVLIAFVGSVIALIVMQAVGN
jgi:hypothetical protein